ncbi:solute carrier family 12 member 9 isoform X2 [Cimex lectularius]|uniref:Solute carrier family 12 member 9 n=1 Tax=Cimex lectularius TaxID=79782 RepID=A0A8I6S630_CIMLE|nr:solute carrier family 12 member 9 isoform X2 [Cimex lectularius]
MLRSPPQEAITMDNTSINNGGERVGDSGMTLPGVLYRRVTGLCGFNCFSGGKKTDEGYVEFGQSDELSPGRTLGTFAGVFSPVALSMFSALLYLRVGFIVGNAGLLVTLLQFIIAYLILFFTVTSICAISTNGAVEGGGAYFMISRTLGPEFGGSIGTLFFLANIVSSALYVIGCAEGIVENFGPGGYLSINGYELKDGSWWRFGYSSVLNLLNLLVCLIGAGMFAKISVIIFIIVCISLASVIVSFVMTGPMEIAIPDVNIDNSTSHMVNATYTGLSWQTLNNNLYQNYTRDYTSNGHMTDFATVFGVLFSGVTGIMAGANMSGELKDPGKSIPWGTMSAVFFTLVSYITVSTLSAATCSRFLMTTNFMYMMPINLVPAFITVGVLTATFSASLSNLIGSSRVLEALAKDNIYGRLLTCITKGVYQGNPVAAVFSSWFLVQIILLIDSLNIIAQINSVLFLLSYFATNLACLGLDLTSAPNFRPSFKYFSWSTALIGIVGTLVMMFVINPLYAISSIVLCFLLIVLLHLFSPSSQTADWGSITQALIFHQVRKYLLMLDSRKDHVKFWRPQVLLLVANPRGSTPLVHFVNDMKKSGLYVLGHVIVGKEFSELDSDPTVPLNSKWLSFVDHLRVKAFVELTVARSLREGLNHLSHLAGLGAMKPNTIVLGFRDNQGPVDFFKHIGSDYMTDKFEHERDFELRDEQSQVDPEEYVYLISDILRMQKNICIARHFHNFSKLQIAKTSNYKYIDVWPVNFFKPSANDVNDTTSLFMLQLSCIIHMVQGWKHLRLRVLLCEDQASISDLTDFSIRRSTTHTQVRLLLDCLRIKAEIEHVENWSRLRASLRGSEMSLDKNNETSRLYLTNVNKLILSKSTDTAISFLYLERPPSDPSLSQDYLDSLTELTANLRPCLLVHGIRAVTSMTL